ncbi:MAG: hypothetical protein RLZZ437_715 [Pseudomonadota bacterium]|jgi:hypothetical protein
MKLYKYCGPNRISDLVHRKIRLTQAIEFNDPFDLSPTYDMLSKEDQERFCLEDQLNGGDGKSFVLTPQRMFLMINATKLGMEFLTRQYQWLGGMFSLNNNLCANLQLSLTFGVLSLSEIHDSLLMWSHYGDQHRGFVIEFDTDNAFFNSNYAQEFPSFLLKVDYSDVRPHLSSTTLNRPEALTRKAKVWAYEQEWRLIRYLKQANEVRSIHEPEKIPAFDALPLHLFSFPEEAVTAIFTGAKMRSDDYQKLTSFLSSDPQYSHVRMHHMLQSDEEFALTTTPPLPGNEDPLALHGKVVSARPMRV